MDISPVYPAKGVFIVFEGGDGAGKSTQSRLLADELAKRKINYLLTREPGGTDVGNALRKILLDPETGAIDGRTEALVYAADKAEHVASVILPELAKGTVVISDRYVDSSLAYQGAGRDLDMEQLEFVLRWATAGVHPNLTVLLDVYPESGLARFDERDRMEAESMEFHLRVREHFIEIAQRDPEHYLIIDGKLPISDIAVQVWERVEPWLSQAN